MKKLISFLVFITPLFLHAYDLKFLNYYPFKVGEKMIFSVRVLGIFIGEQHVTLDYCTNYLGLKVIVGGGYLATTPFISTMYKIEDSEKTFFLPEGFIPLYYERWVNEGSWHDNMKFYFYPGQRTVLIAQKVNNYQKQAINYTGTLRNYFTLISCMRSVDYDYYISNKINVEIDYLFGTTLKKAVFKPSYSKVRYGIEGWIDGIVLNEVGGIGMRFQLIRNQSRTPLRLIVPAFDVIGFKTISVDVELRKHIEGKYDILTFLTNESMDSCIPCESSSKSAESTTGEPTSSSSNNK